MDLNARYIAELKNISKVFHRNIALKNIDLKLKRGETFVLVGNSGTGKSVLGKIIAGLLKPSHGELILFNTPTKELSDREWLKLRRQISIVFQANALFDSLTVFENIAYPLRQHLSISETEIEKRVRQVLQWVLLPDTQHLYPNELSGGMQKRVGIARAVILQPKLIIYDEPTAGLDPVSTSVIDHLIIRLQREHNLTSLVITHNLKSAIRIAHRIGLLHQNRLHFVGTPQQALESSDPIVKKFFEGYKIETALLPDSSPNTGPPL